MLCYIQIWSVRRMRIRKDSDDSNITGGIIVQWGLCNSGCHPKLRGSSSLRPVAEIGKQEHQKSPHSTRYFSPFAFPKFVTLAGVLLKKLLILKVKKYRQIY